MFRWNKILVACLITLAMPALAEEPSSVLDASATSKTKSQWNLDQKHWDKVLSEKPKSAPIQIGKSDFTVSGSLIDGLRPQRASEERTFAKKFLGLPVIRWFVPQRMVPPPTDGGRYFAWRDSGSRPWTSVAERNIAGADPTNPINHKPTTSLISVGK
jgi:hypothetical protein